MAGDKKPLDMVVKLALGVFVTSFVLIFGGMFLTRPDRSIPPYSIGSQQGTIVATHVPSWTSDGEIETLIRRFRKVGREAGDFGPMKIQPTTPDDPKGSYRRITIYIFGDHTWTAPEVLEQVLSDRDPELAAGFRKAVRGTYRLREGIEEGRIGPILDRADSAATAAYSRLLFKGPVGSERAGALTSPADRGAATVPSPPDDGAVALSRTS